MVLQVTAQGAAAHGQYNVVNRAAGHRRSYGFEVIQPEGPGAEHLVWRDAAVKSRVRYVVLFVLLCGEGPLSGMINARNRTHNRVTHADR